MKFSLNGNLYETMYRGRHRITCCNKQIIPMMSFMKAQNLYLENKYKEEKNERRTKRRNLQILQQPKYAEDWRRI